MQRPSILFINRVYPPMRGATGRLLRDLARAFAREGWRVTVVTSGEKSTQERDGAIRVIRVKGSQKPKSALGYLWALIKLSLAALKQPSNHIVVSMTDPPLSVLAGQFIARRKKSRHIHWCQDMYPDLLPVLGTHLPNGIMHALKRKTQSALASCDRIIVIGRCMGRILSNEGHDPRLITFIPNWPDLELVNPALAQGKSKPSAPPHIYSKSYSKPPAEQIKSSPRFRVLYAGNLGLAHPIDTIIDAAAILQKNEPNIEFVFVGEGKGHDALARRRSQRQLDNIRLMPYQPNAHLSDIMQSGDLHMISMHEDAAGLLVPCKLYSAYAAGRPCIFIGPSACETAKSIEDFQAGHVLSQGAPEALASAISSYLHSSDQWFNAQQGAMKAAQTYMPKQSIEAWVKRAWTVIEPDFGPMP